MLSPALSCSSPGLCSGPVIFLSVFSCEMKQSAPHTTSTFLPTSLAFLAALQYGSSHQQHPALTDSSILAEAPGQLHLICRNVMECLVCVWCLQLVSAVGLLNLFLSLGIAFMQLSSPWASPALQSTAPSPSRRPLWVLQKLLCGLTSKHWHSSCDAAKLINLVPPHLEPRHKGFHSLKLELKVYLSQKCPPAPPGICVAVRLEEWQQSSSWE